MAAKKKTKSTNAQKLGGSGMARLVIARPTARTVARSGLGSGSGDGSGYGDGSGDG